jgi:uncharacterized membrane protein (UPF0127 family)
MEPLSERVVSSKNKVQYALEVNRGYFQRKGIKVGDRVKFPCE